MLLWAYEVLCCALMRIHGFLNPHKPFMAPYTKALRILETPEKPSKPLEALKDTNNLGIEKGALFML